MSPRSTLVTNCHQNLNVVTKDLKLINFETTGSDRKWPLTTFFSKTSILDISSCTDSFSTSIIFLKLPCKFTSEDERLDLMTSYNLVWPFGTSIDPNHDFMGYQRSHLKLWFLRWPRMTPKMTKNLRLMMNMVLQREEDGGIWFTICLIGFMIALPTKILLIIFFQYRLLFNIFSDAYASVTFMTKMMLLVWTLLTDGFTLLKVATT